MEQLSFIDTDDTSVEEDSGDLGGDEGKVCSKCHFYLPLTDFSPHGGGNYLRAECRQCNKELNAIRVALKKKHGMPEEGYHCPVCGGSAEDVHGQGNTRNGPWVLDHCHESGEFRGWLCHKCNRALGGFNDNLEILQRAINYLRQSFNAREPQ